MADEDKKELPVLDADQNATIIIKIPEIKDITITLPKNIARTTAKRLCSKYEYNQA